MFKRSCTSGDVARPHADTHALGSKNARTPRDRSRELDRRLSSALTTHFVPLPNVACLSSNRRSLAPQAPAATGASEEKKTEATTEATAETTTTTTTETAAAAPEAEAAPAPAAEEAAPATRTAEEVSGGTEEPDAKKAKV